MAGLDLEYTMETQRERAVVELRDLYARGQLTLGEFNDDLDRVFAATTVAGLGAALPTARNHTRTPAWSGLPPTDLERLVAHLQPDELLCWAGRPDPSALLTRRDLTLIPFSIVWTTFVSIWVFKALGVAGGGWILGLPFLLIGLYMVGGRFAYKAWRKRHTVYAVTDQRALILTCGRKTDRVDSTYLDAVPAISTTTSASGRGSLHLGTADSRKAQWANTGLDFTRVSSDQDGLGLSFFDIADADGVADLVRTLRTHRSDLG